MSNFKAWYSANVQLLKKPENRKIAPMLEFGGRMMGNGDGINGQLSKLRGYAWFLRANAAAAVKAEKGKKPYALVVDCNEIIEEMEKHYKGNDKHARLFEIAYKTRAKAKAAVPGTRSAGEDFAKAEEFGKIADKHEAVGRLIYAAYLKFKKKNYAGMLGDYDKAIGIDPESAHTYLVKRSIAKYEMGDYAGAAEECTAAIELSPRYAEAYYQRSRAKFKMGDMSSIADCGKARELNPERDYTYPHLDWPGRSIEDCSRSIGFDPSNPKLYSTRAELKDKQGDYAGAVEDYTAAIGLLEAQPETLETLRALGNAFYGRSQAKFARSEVSSVFYVTNYSGWKQDESDAAHLDGKIERMLAAQKKAGQVAPATS